jgi:hypothetical protein
MKRVWVCSAICLACAAYAAPVRAQGLYEPFPAPASKEVARKYLNRLPGNGAPLGDSVTNHALQVGAFLRGSGGASLTPATGSSGPSERADARVGVGPSGVIAALAAALVLAAASAWVITARRA